jgi:hypothetical protein
MAIEKHPPSSRFEKTSADVDKSGLACTVLTNHSQAFTALQCKVDVIGSYHAAKGQLQTFGFKQRGHG